MITALALGDGPFSAPFFGAAMERCSAGFAIAGWAGAAFRALAENGRPHWRQPLPVALGAAHRHWSRFDGAAARQPPC